MAQGNTGTVINTAYVNQAGTDIATEVTNLYAALAEIKTLMDGSKSYFKSSGADNLRTKFDQSAAEFEKFKKYLLDHSEYLQKYSGAVKKIDDTIDEIAKSIPALK